MGNAIINVYNIAFTVILADTSSTSGGDKLTSPSIPQLLQDFFSHNIFAWFFWIFVALTIGTAAVAKWTGNLQKIIDFIKSNFLRKPVEIPEEKRLKLRKKLLKRLQSDNLIRIENSLHNLIKIDLEKEEQRYQVGGKKKEQLIPQDREAGKNRFNRLLKILRKKDESTTQLQQNQKIIEFLYRDDIQGKLLILGEPGAGKTTELLSLHKDLIQQAIQDEKAPIPIIFESSSWKSNQTIRDWLIEQLTDIYKGISKKIAEDWIDNQQLIPLVDGLDELGLESQNDCIVALNQFLESSFQPGFVVCCRREEYEQAQTKLERLNGAIYLGLLSDDQIQQYLESLNRSSIWDTSIRNQSKLLELCRKPLFLTMLVVAYQGRAIRNSSELFESYIEQKLDDSDSQGTYFPRKEPTKKQTLHYLNWMANKLEAKGDTEFLIEQIQPTCLESTKQKNFYRIVFSLIIGLIGGLIIGLFFGLIYGLIIGLINGLIFGLIIGLINGLSRGSFKIELFEKLNFSFKKVKNSLIGGLSFGLIGGLSFGLSFGLIRGLSFGLIRGLSFGLSVGLSFVLIFGLSVGLIFGLSFLEFEDKNFPNQGIWMSLKNSLSVGLIFGLGAGLSFGLSFVPSIGLSFGLSVGLSIGLIFVLIGGLFGGGQSVIKHFTLRLILYQNSYIPWNYAKFLDHAAKHRFIQRVGGRYRFMHDLLRKHFAQMRI